MKKLGLFLSVFLLTSCGYSLSGEKMYSSVQVSPALRVPVDLKRQTKLVPRYPIPKPSMQDALPAPAEDLLWPPELVQQPSDSQLS